MLTLIHGNDTALSRKYFMEEKQKYSDAVVLDADKLDMTDLAQVFEGGGLFGETKFLFIEQLVTKRKKNADFKEILSYLEKHADENTIFLWEGKELERGALNVFKKAVVKPFKLPQTLFAFLDEIKPGNSKRLITLLHQTIETTEIEMVFFMLVRQFRMFLALADNQSQTNETIDEVKRMASWQLTKLQKQAKSFEINHLLQLYEQLFRIELGQKTGTLTQSLTSTIDFFLLEV